MRAPTKHLIVPRHGCDFTSEDSVADDRVEEHERKDEKAFSPEHEYKTGMRRCRFVDGEDEGDHVRPERNGQGAKGRQEDQYDHRKGRLIPAVPNTDREHNCRQAADHREDKQMWTLDPSTSEIDAARAIQERRHCLCCSQDAIDYPRLTTHLRRVPAGEDGNEGQ